MERRKIVVSQDMRLPDECSIQALKGTYCYLRTEQMFKPDHQYVKQRIHQEYVRRQWKVWRLGLCGYMVLASNIWALSILRYYLPVLKWSKRELVKSDRKTWEIMRKCKCHH